MKILNLNQIVSISLKDKTFYANVDKHKGKVYYWKLFGIIPIFPYVAQKTTTELRWLTLENSSSNLMVEGDEVYIKPRVVLSFSDKDSEFVFFDTYEDALNYVGKMRGILSDANIPFQEI